MKVKELETYISVVYRPPNCMVESFNEVIKSNDETIVGDSYFSKFRNKTCMSDFNMPNVKWKN